MKNPESDRILLLKIALFFCLLYALYRMFFGLGGF